MPKLKMGALIIAVALFVIWGCTGLLLRRANVPQIKDAQYVGTQKCVEEKCHPKRIRDILDSAHHKLFEQDSLDKPACELCHGKGSLHVASVRDPELILSYKQMSPRTASEICITCHASGALDSWYKSAHYQKDISCNECHLSHGTNDKQLLKAPDPEICYKCHSQVEQRFTLASTHRFAEQGFRCLLCHKSHEKYDTLDKHNIRVSVCLECHEKYGATFKYEHKPVKADCLGCHLAHGSEYPKLSNAKMSALCGTCHFVSHRTFFIARSFTDAEKKLKAGQCSACHKMVHGSKYQYLLDRQPPRMGPPGGFTPPISGGTGAGEQKIREIQPQEEEW